MSQSSSGRKGTAKLTEMLDIQHNIQQKWEQEKVFEVNAPPVGSKEAEYVQYLYKADVILFYIMTC